MTELPAQVAPVAFAFSSTYTVRVVIRDGDPWFVAADVCAALDLDNITKALLRLDDDEQQVVDFATLNSIQGVTNQELNPGQKINLINESGLYSLILGSRKPEAKRFKKWVTSEVLPAIRKTGRYQVATDPAVYERCTPEQQRALTDAMQKAFSTWIFGDQSFQHGCNRLRLNHRLRHLADLPAAEFDRAMATVAELDTMNRAFTGWVMEALHVYLTEYVEAGGPWTLWLTRNWKQWMGTALPPRPDWLAIQAQLKLAKDAWGSA
jgi:prophage antirepressor-like protein